MFCESCGTKNPNDAKHCIKCGSEKLVRTQTFQAWKAKWQMMGSGQQIVRLGCALIMLLFVIAIIVSQLNQGGPKSSSQSDNHSQVSTPAPSPRPANLINYEILRQWTPGGGGIGMDVLVKESATKKQVMELGRYLRKEFDYDDFILITIFDNRKVGSDLMANLPPSMTNKHTLVSITRNTSTGLDDINWVAEGRNH